MARPEESAPRIALSLIAVCAIGSTKSKRWASCLKVNGAHWDREMGSITQMLTESGKGKAPAILFDEVPGYPKGYRTLYGQFSTIKRVALTLGLPLEYEHKADIVKAYHHVMTDMKLIKPKMVKTGPIFENVLEGDKVDVLKLPVPIHHQADTHRYVGTADMCITKDPDADWYNFGAYRCEVYDGKTIGCQITEGKHGRIHRDKYFERGQSCKFAIVCGQDPLLYHAFGEPVALAECPSMISPAASAANRWKLSKDRLPDFRFLPTPRSLSKAKRCRDRASPKGRSANGWAIIPTMSCRARI